ncbi:MAG: magnesium transporter [Pirellulaceae bacterium]|nr:magnesium transporter [Pirellulaceae bacterium]
MAKVVSDHHLGDLALDHAHQNFVRLQAGETVGDGLRRVQGSRVEGRIVYFYVVDEEDRLQGVIPTRRLLLNPSSTPLADIMERQVVAIPETATLLEACEFFILHRFLALPIVDAGGRIVGVLDVEMYTDEISDLIRHEENEDIFQLIGVHLAQVQQASVPVAFRRRFPWLICNIAGGLACAVLAGLFKEVLAEAIVLAMFIPIVLALAESVSVQSLTLAVQIHDLGGTPWNEAVRRLRREVLIGVLLGLACGAIVGLASLGWQHEAWQHAAKVGLVISASITLSVTTAAVFGLSVPVGLRAIQRDPRIASGPIVLAMTDIATLFYYLGLATVVLC